MKMVKSLLLVSAAGLVAVSGAQAADLPVKAKPVEYVKVCSLYGAGFYYIPGTDICMKVGGYIRYQQNWGSTDITGGPFAGVGAANTRSSSADQTYRSRALATFDTRQQTSYGTLRTYLIIGASQDSGTDTDITAAVRGANSVRLYANRAFIQIAGFTFGKASSFFDFVSSAAVAYNAGNTYSPDTGDGGHVVVAYTHQFGNGISATISAEQERTRGVAYLGAAVGGGGGGLITTTNTDLAGGNRLQDIVANLRIDQAWGSAQVAVAAHNAGVSYYGQGAGGATINEWNGAPSDKWGWAATVGLRLNAPMIGPGDYFQAAFHYGRGATQYASNTPTTTNYWSGSTVGFSIHNDGGFTGTVTTPGIYELTTAWSVFASYEHFWTPSLRTSLYGSYLNIERSDALNNAMCGSNTAGVLGGQLIGAATTRAGGCDLDSSQWNIGSRSQWNVTKDFYVGVDVIYHKLRSATLNAAGTANLGVTTVPGKVSGNFYTTADQDALAVAWRVHRDIVP
jgi:Porin subfamily